MPTAELRRGPGLAHSLPSGPWWSLSYKLGLGSRVTEVEMTLSW